MNRERRFLVTAGLASTAAMAMRSVSAHERHTPGPAGGGSFPPLDGEIRVDELARTAAAEDFGHIVHHVPELVVRAASERDVTTTIRWASAHGRRCAAQGQRHSVFGRAQVRDGVVIDMSGLRAVERVDADRVSVQAGATWSDVLSATLPRELTPPVLTDYLELSVGGTLIAGGVGGTISRFGAQCDNVLAMDVVTGTGERLTCSPDGHVDLFDAVRAGLGQAGIVTRATLRLVAAPRQIRRFLLTYPDLQALLQDERRLVNDERFDAVQGAVVAVPAGGWAFRLDLARGFSSEPPDDHALLAGLSDTRASAQRATLPYLAYVRRLAALEEALRANGQWFYPHPWLTTFVGDAAVESTVAAELERLTPADVGPFGQIVLSPFRRQSVTSPLLRLPADDVCYAFNVIRVPTTDSVAQARRLVAANRRAYRRIRAAGGTLYPVSAFPMSPRDWRQHFGPAFEQLQDAKRQYDPDRVLAPGYHVFERAA